MAEYVTNPDTGRQIRVGGTRYLSLLNRYYDIGGRLVTRPLIRVSAIFDPSDGEVDERDGSYAEVADDDQMQLLAAILFPAGEIDEETTEFDGDLVRDAWYSRYAAVLTVDWGGFEIQLSRSRASAPRVAQSVMANRLLANRPLKLPFTNVDLNDGLDDKCVERWLGYPVEDTSIEGIMATVNGMGRSCEILDIFGKRVMAVGLLRDDSPRGLMYQGHVYPLHKNPNGQFLPSLIEQPVTYMHPQQREGTIEYFKQSRCAYYEKDGVLYHAERGVFKPAPATNDAQREFLATLPQYAWDPVDLIEFKNAALPLFVPNDKEELLSIDMTKCYYNVAQRLLNPSGASDELNRLSWALFEPDMFIKPIPFEDWTPRPIEPQHWVVVHPRDMVNIRRLFGIVSPLMCRALYNELHTAASCGMFGPALPPGGPDIIYIYPFQKARPASVQTIEKLDAWLDDPVMQKGYAMVNGACGRVINVKRRSFELNERFAGERAWYGEKHHMTWHTNMMTHQREKLLLANRFHLHVSVIQHASALVVLAARRMFETYHIKPYAIKTDALGYRRTDISKLALIYAGGDVQRILFRMQDAAALATGMAWVPESMPVSDKAMPAPRPWGLPASVEHPYVRQYANRNRTHYGPPGSGKTTEVIDLMPEDDPEFPDFFITYTNRNARRISRPDRDIRGTTVHSLLGIAPGTQHMEIHPNWQGLIGKRIFVDEAQSLPRWIWMKFVTLFHRFNVSFTFAMDPDQLAPIDDGDNPITLNCSFLGTRIPHTFDYRNDPDLVLARGRVLAGTFEPDLKPPVFDPESVTDVNIAAYNRTCELVNEWYTKHHGIQWGGIGSRYIVDYREEELKHKLPPKVKKAWPKGTMLTVRLDGDGRKWCYNSETGDAIGPWQGHDKLLKFAYCVTTDKMIGSTIRQPFTIWDATADWFYTRHGLLYTALTRGVRLADITFRGTPCEAMAASEEDARRTLELMDEQHPGWDLPDHSFTNGNLTR